MTRFGDNYHHHHYHHNHQHSPSVSPKSIPHGFKRKASTQADDVESNSLISNSFKKLRLQSKRPSTITSDFAPVGVSYRGLGPSEPSLGNHHGPQSRNNAYPVNAGHSNGDDYMPVDETTDRIWIHDLDAEIAAIEAEEAQQGSGILSHTGKEYSKIPEHLLNQKAVDDDPAANMQVILYRDPISISVPEENDAVRKTIIEARKRMREKQAEERNIQAVVPPVHQVESGERLGFGEDDDDGMDLD